MNFEELDTTTRECMLAAFDDEEAANPYRSPVLSVAGNAAYPNLMRQAIMDPGGNEATLAAALDRAELWNPTEGYVRDGVARDRKVNPRFAAERLAVTEFNTWYVAGLARKLLAEGETHCEVYRAAEPKWEHASCSVHEGHTYSLEEILAGHRAEYWPPPGVAGRLSIPAGPGCHHTIRRLRP